MKTQKSVRSFLWMFLLAAGGVGLCLGCRGMEIGLKEAFGIPKRDQLVDEVTEARDAQNEAKEQFASALEQFSTVLNYDGGDLEEKYKILNEEYEKSKSKAAAVAGRIERVKEVSAALFQEWEKELDQYTSDRLRRSSERKLEQTRARYNKLMTAMERARDKIDPVLAAFRDQVLFLKHNLNARAIASLQSELDSIESDIAVLVREMEASIAEANAFIEQITGQETVQEREMP